MIDLLEWQEAVNSALMDGNPCILATNDGEGRPDIAFKGSMMIFDGEHLAWWERSLGEQIAQVEQNPNVVVLYRSAPRKLTLRFYGQATIHKEGPLREEVMERTIPIELEKDPERKGYGVIVQVDRVRSGSNTIQERDGAS